MAMLIEAGGLRQENPELRGFGSSGNNDEKGLVIRVAARKIILQMMVTLDGFVAGPDDEMDWIDNDPLMGEAHFALAQGADASIIGHGVYQGMAQFWPQAAANPDAPNNEAEFGKLMNDIHKIVVSTRAEDLQWTNCEQLLVNSDEDLIQRITELKNQPGEYLLLYGGVRTAQTFVGHNLVDEYRLDVCPTALGSGRRLFPERTKLTLVRATPYQSGAMTVVYRAR
jgi:dihydrofolate reductase